MSYLSSLMCLAAKYQVTLSRLRIFPNKALPYRPKCDRNGGGTLIRARGEHRERCGMHGAGSWPGASSRTGAGSCTALAAARTLRHFACAAPRPAPHAPARRSSSASGQEIFQTEENSSCVLAEVPLIYSNVASATLEMVAWLSGRASPSHGGGHRFKSCSDHHETTGQTRVWPFC